MEQFDKPDYVFTYTRKQAIEDGVLVDITDTAKNYGFVIPVCITANLLNCYVKPSPECEELGQSLEARLADVLTVLYFVIKTKKNTSRITFKVDFLMEPERSETVNIIADIGPGDTWEPVLTIMLPEDD